MNNGSTNNPPVSTADLEILPFSPQVQDDVLTVVNTYVAGWPYTRPIDADLIAHWQTMPRFGTENVWLARRDGRPVAFLHGEFHEDQARVHLLALLPGQVVAATELLAQYEAKARAAALARLVGPTWVAQAFYGGYLTGHEPFHPHWATEASEAYVRAGFRLSGASVLMVRDLSEPIAIEPAPAPYRIVEMPGWTEYGAQTFSYRTFLEDKEVAHCYGRLFPQLKGAQGGPVGQLGHIGTDEAHQGKGLARRMVNASLMRLKEMGGAEMLIVTGLDNYPALASYERAGFRRRHPLWGWSKALR